MYKGKKAQMNILTVIIGIALLLFIVPQIPFLQGIVPGGGGGAAPAPPGGLAPDGVCPIGAVIEDVTVTWDIIDKHNPGETVDGGTDDEVYWEFINGEISGLRPGNAAGDGDDDAGTETFSPGDKIKIYWAFDPTGIAASNSYYTLITEETIPCRGTKTLTGRVVNASTGTTYLTARLFSEDDGLVVTETAANTEQLIDGNTDCLDGFLQVPEDAGIPYGGCMVADFTDNSTALDTITMKFKGVEAASCPIPDIHTEAFYDAISSQITDAGRASKGFVVPSMEDTEKIDWQVCIKDDTTGTFGLAPIVGMVNFTLWDYDHVWSDNDNKVVLAPEDPDNDVDVGIANANAAARPSLTTGIILSTT